MNAKSFAKSGAGAVPMNMPDDCLYTTRPNCTNPSTNTNLVRSHSLVLPTLNCVLLLVISLVFTGGLGDHEFCQSLVPFYHS